MKNLSVVWPYNQPHLDNSTQKFLEYMDQRLIPNTQFKDKVRQAFPSIKDCKEIDPSDGLNADDICRCGNSGASLETASSLISQINELSSKLNSERTYVACIQANDKVFVYKLPLGPEHKTEITKAMQGSIYHGRRIFRVIY